MKGVAHVLVQESNCTNNELRNLCGDQNEYFGAIGIYYANPAIGHKRYLYRTSVGMDTYLLEKVVRVVIQNSNAQLIDTLYTWQGVNNALLRDKFITTRKIDSFESLAKFIADKEQKYSQLETVHLSKGQKLSRLKELSKMYALYEPYRTTYKESQSLKGLAKMKYDKEHKDSLSKYPELRERMPR